MSRVEHIFAAKNTEVSETSARNDLLVAMRRVLGDTEREVWAGNLANALTGLSDTWDPQSHLSPPGLHRGTQRPSDVTRHHRGPRTSFLPLSCSSVNIDCRRFDGLASRLWSPTRCHTTDDTSRAVPQNATRGRGGLPYPRLAPHFVPGSSRGQLCLTSMLVLPPFPQKSAPRPVIRKIG